jgi:hypothetical protein
VNLAERVRRALGKRKGLAEKKMFGGLAFMLDNRMCCGVINNDLVVRVGPDQYESALAQPHARRLDFTGRPLKGFVYRVTSGGSAVVETVFAGSDHEMVTVYHLDGDDLVLTHYCMLGNQPRMKAERGSDPKKSVFKFAGGTNIKPDSDLHMHEAVFEFIDDDHFTSSWTLYRDGKPATVAKIDLRRVKK